MGEEVSHRRRSAKTRVLDDIWLWVKNKVTPKWVSLVNGKVDENLRSISWCLNFDPHPFLLGKVFLPSRPLTRVFLERKAVLQARGLPP